MGKRVLKPIERGSVRLRLLEASDLETTRAWRNQDEIRKWFFHSEIVLPEQHAKWFEDYSTRDDDFLFVIEEILELEKPVGQLGLYRIDWVQRKAEFGRLLIGERDARGRGIARKATELALDFAFQELGIQEVRLEVLRDNEAAKAIYAKCGFRAVADTGDRIEMVKRPSAGSGEGDSSSQKNAESRISNVPTG